MANSFTHLQANTYHLNSPQKVIDFFLNHEIDIACLQEINLPQSEAHSFTDLCTRHNLHYVQGVHYFNQDDDSLFGCGILSRHPIIDNQCFYFNSDKYEPKHISKLDIIGPMLKKDHLSSIPGSRGIKYSIVSNCILKALIKVSHNYLIVITTHFPVSDNCIEISEQYNLALLTKSLITYSSSLPTIFSADLNLRAVSYSVQQLNQVMDLHTADLTNTLSANHPALQNDFPQGLAVDHVFSKNLKHTKTTTKEVDFSDHQFLISKFTF